ncbi:CSN8-PSD8-EIF3K domain-containing protein [Mycena kentingensis (nom. inval.)]|nr:CSN8-PSD8-EIF3K domain-containing protein [Mycena kentingensis (nom. inval.)]
MSTAGPPTPPPTSATELQDAARASVPPSASSSSVPAAARAPDILQQLFPSIASLASEQKYKELIRFAEYNDIGTEGDRQATRFLLTAPLVLAYLIHDELPSARCALQRLPRDLQSSPLCTSLMHLLASTSERKYEHIYTRANELIATTSGADFPEAPLGAIMALMLNNFLETFRLRTFALLQKAYTSIPLSLAQMYLGANEEQVLTEAQKTGWSYEASTQVLTPPQRAVSGNSASEFKPFSTLATFETVASSVAKLET